MVPMKIGLRLCLSLTMIANDYCNNVYERLRPELKHVKGLIMALNFFPHYFSGIKIQKGFSVASFKRNIRWGVDLANLVKHD